MGGQPGIEGNQDRHVEVPGLNVAAGKVTHPGVAEAFDMECRDPLTVL